MKKALLFVLCMLFLPLFAHAEEAGFAAQWFEAQKAETIPAGIEAAIDERVYTLALPDGRDALSLCLTVEGDLRFGRYAQLVRTGLIDEATGEDVSLDAVFTDLDALQEFMDTYVEENVLDSLNTYLDANDLLPVPLDAVCMDAQGVTFHYPMERFQYFSGHAGAVQLQWYELREMTRVSAAELPLPLLPGGAIEDLLTAHGSLTDPDLVTGGELYEFEDPALRGVEAISDAEGTVAAVRYSRFEWRGARPGMTRQEAEAAAGAPGIAVPLDDGAARGLRLETGMAAQYAWDENTLITLYYDDAELLYKAELRLR